MMTSRMQRIIVADTSCLILMDKLRLMELLHSLFGSILITSAVAKEFGQALPSFIEIKNPINPIYQKLLEFRLDLGEASALALALEYENCLLIIDDNKGRKEAKQLGIAITGTVGVLIIAKHKGHISSIGPFIKAIEKTDFRISKKILNDALGRCGEEKL